MPSQQRSATSLTSMNTVFASCNIRRYWAGSRMAFRSAPRVSSVIRSGDGPSIDGPSQIPCVLAEKLGGRLIRGRTQKTQLEMFWSHLHY